MPVRDDIPVQGDADDGFPVVRLAQLRECPLEGSHDARSIQEHHLLRRLNGPPRDSLPVSHGREG